MAAQHGKNGRIYVEGFDMTAHAKSIGLDLSEELPDVTTFGTNSKKYMKGISDGTLQTDGVYDDDKDTLDATFDAIKATTAICSYYPALDTRGNFGYSFKAMRSAYATTASITDAVNYSFGSQCSEDVDRVRSITPKIEIETNSSTTSLDMGAGGSAGAKIYVQIFAVDDMTDVIIEHSTNNSTWATLAEIEDADETGGTLLVVTGTVNRYIRVTIAGLGAEESITLQAGIKLN